MWRPLFPILVLVYLMMVPKAPADEALPPGVPGFKTEYVSSKYILPDTRLPRTPKKVAYVSSLSSELSPQIVLVIALDAEYARSYLDRLLLERIKFAKRHHLGIFARYMQDYLNPDTAKPLSKRLARKARLRLIRQAIDAFPRAQWLWYLDDHGRILNRELGLEWLGDIEAEMLRGFSVGGADVRTMHHNTVRDIALVAAPSPNGGISSRSLILRVGDVSRALIETALDPIYHRCVPFEQTSDPVGALLTHIFEWHPRFLRATAIVPPARLGTSPRCSPKEFVCIFDPPVQWSDLDTLVQPSVQEKFQNR